MFLSSAMRRTTLILTFSSENCPAVADGIQNPISTDENSQSLIIDKMIGYQCLENVPGIPNVRSCVIPKKTKSQLHSFTRKFDVGKCQKQELCSDHWADWFDLFMPTHLQQILGMIQNISLSCIPNFPVRELSCF